MMVSRGEPIVLILSTGVSALVTLLVRLLISSVIGLGVARVVLVRGVFVSRECRVLILVT